jgi:hypothetical protein
MICSSITITREKTKNIREKGGVFSYILHKKKKRVGGREKEGGERDGRRPEAGQVETTLERVATAAAASGSRWMSFQGAHCMVFSHVTSSTTQSRERNIGARGCVCVRV